MAKIKIKSGGSWAALKLNLLKYRNVFTVYDSNVEKLALKLGREDKALAICADEAHKSIDTVLKICHWLLENGADRSSVLLAVGGGITTDVCGFAAAIYKRGIKVINVPTTLLAMVDAGIGGKNGVNFENYKNVLGTIRQAEFTYICPSALETLSEREYRSGVAELLKTFLIKDGALYRKCVEALSSGEELNRYIKKAARIKAGIVRKDENEKDKRRILNFGHTYGHAIEWWQASTGQAEPFTHGEAVALGMIKAAGISEEKGIAEPGLADMLRNDFRICGLPTEFPCGEEELKEALKQDKKTENGDVNFVFIKRPGSVKIKKYDLR